MRSDRDHQVKDAGSAVRADRAHVAVIRRRPYGGA